MNGRDFCDELKNRLGAGSDAELALQVGLTAGRICQIRTKKNISARMAATYVQRACRVRSKDALSTAIQPIVEFFPIDPHQASEKGREIPFNSKSDDGKHLKRNLKDAKGIYSFYNSQAEIIYFGKTVKLSLYDEMVNAFNRELPNFSLYRVRHPWGRYKSAKAEDLRKLKREQVYLYDAASYFSAYSVADGLISDIEALFIRIAPNDIINVRMEKSKLKAFASPEV